MNFIDFLQNEANVRERIHANHASSRPLSKNYDFVGLAGEAEFMRIFRQPMDTDRKPGGDSKIDFTVPLKFTVDVKTARKALNLIVEVGEVEADIYVLASFSDKDQTAELLGWEWGKILKKAPSKDFGYGIINHYIPRENLRPIDELIEKVMYLK